MAIAESPRLRGRQQRPAYAGRGAYRTTWNGSAFITALPTPTR
jgi:hypothetical protein